MDIKKESGTDGKIIFRPPDCPECGNALFRVNRVQMNFQIMTFDNSYGAFQEGLQHHDIHGRMVCPFCGHFLGVCKPA